MSPALQKAHKLYTLARRGEGGEAASAQRRLDAHLRKHGLAMDDVLAGMRRAVRFPTEGAEHEAFLHQVLHSVRGPCVPTLDGTELVCDLTTAEAREARRRVVHYWPQWQRERALFWRAFVQRSGLFAVRLADAGPTPVDAPPPATPEQQAEALRVARLAQQMHLEPLPPEPEPQPQPWRALLGRVLGRGE